MMNPPPSVRSLLVAGTTVAAMSTLGALTTGPAFAGPTKKVSAHKLEVGRPAPDFQLRAPDNTKFALKDLAYPGREKRWAKKQPLMVDFFRTDCTPCKKALPQLVALHELHAEEGLRILLIGLLERGDDGRDKLLKYLAEHPVPFTVVIDRNENVAKKYIGEVADLPATFLIDRNGILVQSKFSAKGELSEYFADSLRTVLAEHADAKADDK